MAHKVRVAYCSIDVDPSGNINIGYSTVSDHTLRNAFRSFGVWNIELVDQNGLGEQYTSLVLDSQNLPNISYYDLVGRRLKYSRPILLNSVSPFIGDGEKNFRTPLSIADGQLTEASINTDFFSDNLTGIIAFHSSRTCKNEIYVIKDDGRNPKQMTFSSNDARIPIWSPDGNQLAYRPYIEGDFELFTLNLSDLSARQVTDNDCDDYASAWSPDGKDFGFYSNCDGNREIYVMNVDGSEKRQLTMTTDVYNWFPTWSPTGDKITFSSNRLGRYFIYVMNPDGSNQQAIARGCKSSSSPDGHKIIYTTYCTDLGEILIMDADGLNIKELTTGCNCSNPSWPPDGLHISFQSNRSGNEDVWIMNNDGTNWIQLTYDPALDASPVWRP